MTDWHRLIERLDPVPDGESPVRYRSGIVDAVNGDGTIDVNLGGTVVPDVKMIGQAVVAESVDLLVWRGDMLALGHSGSRGVLGRAIKTTNQGGITSETALTGLSVTTPPIAAGRLVRVDWLAYLESSVAGDLITLRVNESGVAVRHLQQLTAETANRSVLFTGYALLTPSAGSPTYDLSAERAGGTGTVTLAANSARTASILVEDKGAA